jgi:hypothetical protein
MFVVDFGHLDRLWKQGLKMTSVTNRMDSSLRRENM